MRQDDICSKLHKIESYINSVDQERDRMRQENAFLRDKLQASIRQNRILSGKIENASKKVRFLIKNLKEDVK